MHPSHTHPQSEASCEKSISNFRDILLCNLTPKSKCMLCYIHRVLNYLLVSSTTPIVNSPGGWGHTLLSCLVFHLTLLSLNRLGSVMLESLEGVSPWVTSPWGGGGAHSYVMFSISPYSLIIKQIGVCNAGII